MPQKTSVIQESGIVELPKEFLEKYGLKVGDEITYIETEHGLFIGSREALVDQLLDDIGADLRITLDELIESGREERSALLKELYGIDT